jgi:hypothetical protein
LFHCWNQQDKHILLQKCFTLLLNGGKLLLSIWFKVSYKVTKWLFAIFFYKFISTTLATIHVFLQKFRKFIVVDHMIYVQLRVCFSNSYNVIASPIGEVVVVGWQKGILEVHRFWFSSAAVFRPPWPPTPISEMRRLPLERGIILSYNSWCCCFLLLVDLLNFANMKTFLSFMPPHF